MLHSLPATLAWRVVDRLVADHQLVSLSSEHCWTGTRGKELIYAPLVVPVASVDRHIVVAFSRSAHLVLDASCCSETYELRVSVVPSALPALVVRPSSREFADLFGVVDGYVEEWSRVAG